MVTATAPKTRSRPKKTPRVPTPLTIALGQNLQRIRIASGKTQVMLAYEAEVERSRISKLECGYINPSLLTLGSICYCLGTTLAVLFEGITETFPPTTKGGSLRRANQAVLEKLPSAGRRRP